MTGKIRKTLPESVIVGSTSVGEILNGKLQVGTVLASFSFFEETELKAFALEVPVGNEADSGRRFIRSLTGQKDMAGALIFGTPHSIDLGKLLSAMSEVAFDFPVFGGGAGVYDSSDTSLIFLDQQFFAEGVIAVALISHSLRIITKTFLGWKPLSKEMTITEADGKILKRIDGEPAYDVYNRYLDIPNDKNFFSNALEFPIIVQKNGEYIARTPFFVTEDGSIGLLADLESGEKFHIGYGQPDLFLNNSASVMGELFDFQPDAIFLYACICRRFLLQDAIDLETQVFNQIAPSNGFYTFGEINRQGQDIMLLNSTIVVVGMREGKPAHPSLDITVTDESPIALSTDPFATSTAASSPASCISYGSSPMNWKKRTRNSPGSPASTN